MTRAQTYSLGQINTEAEILSNTADAQTRLDEAAKSVSEMKQLYLHCSIQIHSPSLCVKDVNSCSCCHEDVDRAMESMVQMLSFLWVLSL